MIDRRDKIQCKNLKREINRIGKDLTVFREVLDRYGEATGNYKAVAIIKGVFHIQKGYIKQEKSDGTTVLSKGEPRLLIMYEKAKYIQSNDRIEANNKIYRINGYENINNLDIVADISLSEDSNNEMGF